MILDLFAGAGGWSEGLHSFGPSDVGIELDASACATRRAAGHETIEADITTLSPVPYPWQGSKTKQFEQIGNAVPPLLAAAVFRQFVASAVSLEAAA